MFYKIQFKNNLSIQDFETAFSRLSNTLTANKFQQWNDDNEQIDLAKDGILPYPTKPIKESVGGIEVKGDYNNRDEFFKAFKKTIIDALKYTPYEVTEVYISDSQVANSQTQWFQIPS